MVNREENIFVVDVIKTLIYIGNLPRVEYTTYMYVCR